MSKGASTFPNSKEIWPSIAGKSDVLHYPTGCFYGAMLNVRLAPSYKGNISLVLQHVIECFSFRKASNSLALKPSDVETAVAENL